MSYWLARAAGSRYEPEEFDVMESWLFRSFGQAAVPGLIEAMKEEAGCLVWTELQALGSPETVKALIHALKHCHPGVRSGAASVLCGSARGPGRNNPDYVEPFREAISELLNTLKAERDPYAIHMALMFLHDFGSPFEPAFLFSKAISECGRPHLLVHAVRHYPECFQQEDVAPILITSLDDDDPAVRLAAAEAL